MMIVLFDKPRKPGACKRFARFVDWREVWRFVCDDFGYIVFYIGLASWLYIEVLPWLVTRLIEVGR